MDAHTWRGGGGGGGGGKTFTFANVLDHAVAFDGGKDLGVLQDAAVKLEQGGGGGGRDGGWGHYCFQEVWGGVEWTKWGGEVDWVVVGWRFLLLLVGSRARKGLWCVGGGRRELLVVVVVVGGKEMTH